MLESSFQNLAAVETFPNPLDDQLQRFTASLKKQGYADRDSAPESERCLRIVASG